jgi:hypothetical protein
LVVWYVVTPIAALAVTRPRASVAVVAARAVIALLILMRFIEDLPSVFRLQAGGGSPFFIETQVLKYRDL